jgi:ABC-type multidrug transport system ATPase subunit
LDEPTAALDAKSENYIKDSLSQMIEGKTVMMVTHRKALLALMHTVYVLESGKLINVNELGGLDAYLAQLEGINIQIAEQVDEDMPAADLADLPVDDIIDQNQVAEYSSDKTTQNIPQPVINDNIHQPTDEIVVRIDHENK